MGVLLLQTWIWLGFKSVINIVNQQLFQLQSFIFQDTVYVFFRVLIWNGLFIKFKQSDFLSKIVEN